MSLAEELKNFFMGDVATDDATLTAYSHDASLCVVRPKLVAYPKDPADIEHLVQYVAEHKREDQTLSIAVRSAGTCMAGGSLNESIILDVMRYMHGLEGIKKNVATVLPGTFYRDFERETLKQKLILPCYPASRELCALGGMIGNNGAGEKTLRYGKIENFVEALRVIFSDGKEYDVKPLSKDELDHKIAQNDFEGNIYKEMYNLVSQNAELLKQAKPKVSKNSAGYYLWNIVNFDNRIGAHADAPGLDDSKYFDLTKLIVGSEGTLGIVTKAEMRLVPVKAKSRLFVIFMRDLTRLSELVNVILPLDPESLECYDDATMKLAIRFFPEMMKSMKMTNFMKFVLSFMPEAGMILTGGLPKLILLVEFADDSDAEIDAKMKMLAEAVRPFHFKTHDAKSGTDTEKYWTIRRESFNLLRKHVRGRRTAPFVDDVVVKPENMPEFLPKMRAILDSYDLLYSIAGHAGNGNFHIIPLMDMHDVKNKDIIFEVADKVFDLVASYGGSNTGEHNDGIIRTPYLGKMYSPEVLDLFQKTKNIFDPQNIFNPGKKVGGTIEYFKNHIASE